MKRFAVAVALLVLALAGCEMRAEITVSPDGSGTMGLTLGIEKSTLAMLSGFGEASEDPFEEFRKDLADDPVPWKVERYSTKELTGMRATFRFESIEDLLAKAKLMSDAQEGSAAFDDVTLRKTATGWEFRSTATGPDLSSAGGRFPGGSSGGLEGGAPPGPPEGFPTGFPTDFPSANPLPSSLGDLGEGFGQLAGMIDIQFRVTLPGRSSNTNATEIERRGGSTTFIWKVNADQQGPTSLAATTVGFGGGGSFPVVPVAAGGAALLGGAAVMALRRRRPGPMPPVPVLEGAWPSPPEHSGDAATELPAAASGEEGSAGV